MALSYNEFQRQLQNRGIEPRLAYFFSLIWERLLELAKQGDEGAEIMLQMANSMQGLVQLSEADRARAQRIARKMGAADGDPEVYSEAITNIEDKD